MLRATNNRVRRRLLPLSILGVSRAVVKSRLSPTRFENCGVTIGRMHGAPDDLEVLTMGRVSVDRNQRDALVMVTTQITQLVN
jgi:hypothetical protein